MLPNGRELFIGSACACSPAKPPVCRAMRCRWNLDCARWRRRPTIATRQSNASSGCNPVSKSIDQEQRLAALSDLRGCLTIAEEIGELEVVEGADPAPGNGRALRAVAAEAGAAGAAVPQDQGLSRTTTASWCNVRSSRVFNDGGGLELVQNYRKHRRKSAEPIPSEHVGDGPVFENVLMDNQVDVLAFPAPKWHGRRRRPLHRHRMHGDRAGPGLRLGQCRHLPRVGPGQARRCRCSSSLASTPTPSARNGGRGASIARWW